MNDQVVLNAVRSLHNAFFESLEGDANSVNSFAASWSSFSELIATLGQQLGIETLEMVHSLAETIRIVSSGVLDLHSTSDEMEEDLNSDIARILGGELGHLTLEDDGLSMRKVSSKALKSPAPYIETCYNWLLENLGNPYPSESFRLSTSRQFHCTKKDVDNWFIDARARIGWNRLRKRHFGNKRLNIVDAAQRFFVKDDALRPLPSHIESEFASLQACAQALYSGKFRETKLATKLDVAVKDLTPQLKVQIEECKDRKKMQSRRKHTPPNVALSYPTPESSPEASSPASLPSSPPALQRDFGGVSPTLKRRRSSTEQPEDEQPHCVDHKRKRLDAISLEELPCSHSLPSPAASVTTIAAESAPETQLAPSNKRKRRLSVDGDGRVPKRPHHALSGPRVQAVSDPTPLPAVSIFPEASFDDFFTQLVSGTFQQVPPVTLATPEPDTPLEIEVFDFTSFQPLNPLPPLENMDRTALPPHLATCNINSADTNTSTGPGRLLPELPLDDLDFNWLNSSSDHLTPIQDGKLTHSNILLGYSHLFIPDPSSFAFGFNLLDIPNFSQGESPSNLWSNSLSNGSYEELSCTLAIPNVTNIQFPATTQDSLTLPQQHLPALNESEIEAKRKRLLELESQAMALRAEISAA